jgi:hypothetical protein
MSSTAAGRGEVMDRASSSSGPPTASKTRQTPSGAEDGDEMAEEELHEDIERFFPMLKDYVAAAAAKGEGLAIWMT